MPIRDTSDAGGFGFLDQCYIYGSADAVQLTVRGHSTQTNYLQLWETSASGLLAAVDGAGYWGMGVAPTTDKQLWVYRQETADFGANWRSLQVHAYATSLQSGQVAAMEAGCGISHAAGNVLQGTGLLFNCTKTGAGTATRLYGIFGGVTNVGSGNITHIRGGNYQVYQGGAGLVNNLYALDVGTHNTAGTCNNAYGLRISATVAGGAVTNLYGVRVLDIAGGTNSWALRTEIGLVQFGDNVLMQETETLTGNVADDYAAGLALDPGYTGAFTVTRHNYIDVQDVSLAGGAAVTDAPVMRFDAAIGTHKSLPVAFQTTDSNADTTNWAGGLLININGTLYKIPYIAV